jgi:rhodanese-related sulfurtransferase
LVTELPPSRIDQMLSDARAQLRRVNPRDLAAEVTAGALVVDIRPVETRISEGELPGAVAIDRNVLEWRLDPTSAHRIPGTGADRRVVLVCNEGYQSSLAAAALQRLGLPQATDLVGGYRLWRSTVVAAEPDVPDSAGDRAARR